MISAQEAYRIGLVNEVVPAADLVKRAEAILEQISANGPIAVRFAWKRPTRGWMPVPARASLWKPHTSASALQPRTRRKARRPSSRSAHPSSTDGEGTHKGRPW